MVERAEDLAGHKYDLQGDAGYQYRMSNGGGVNATIVEYSPYGGTKQGVTQAEYDRLSRMNQGASQSSRGELKFNVTMQRFEMWRPEDPMSRYYVIQDPAASITRRTIEIQTPANPGIRKVAVSTYGIAIPVSVGRRVITGNIIDANPITPRLVGGGTRVEVEREPIYPSGPS